MPTSRTLAGPSPDADPPWQKHTLFISTLHLHINSPLRLVFVGSPEVAQAQ